MQKKAEQQSLAEKEADEEEEKRPMTEHRLWAQWGKRANTKAVRRWLSASFVSLLLRAREWTDPSPSFSHPSSPLPLVLSHTPHSRPPLSLFDWSWHPPPFLPLPLYRVLSIPLSSQLRSPHKARLRCWIRVSKQTPAPTSPHSNLTHRLYQKTCWREADNLAPTWISGFDYRYQTCFLLSKSLPTHANNSRL